LEQADIHLALQSASPAPAQLYVSLNLKPELQLLSGCEPLSHNSLDPDAAASAAAHIAEMEQLEAGVMVLVPAKAFVLNKMTLKKTQRFMMFFMIKSLFNNIF